MFWTSRCCKENRVFEHSSGNTTNDKLSTMRIDAILTLYYLIFVCLQLLLLLVVLEDQALLHK